MPRYLWDLINLLLANAVGFLAANFWYVLGVKTGAFPITQENFDPIIVKEFFNKTIMIWLICAFFSLFSLFMHGLPRYAFMLAPAMIPMLYGFSVLVLS
jgi:hypothetical protein